MGALNDTVVQNKELLAVPNQGVSAFNTNTGPIDRADEARKSVPNDQSFRMKHRENEVTFCQDESF